MTERAEIIVSECSALAQEDPEVLRELLWRILGKVDPIALVDEPEAFRLAYAIREATSALDKVDRMTAAMVIDDLMVERIDQGFGSAFNYMEIAAEAATQDWTVTERRAMLLHLLTVVDADAGLLNHMKLLLMRLWKNLPKPTRKSFIARVDADGDFIPRTEEEKRIEDAPLSIHSMLNYWPTVISYTEPGTWDREFAMSIDKRRGQRGANWTEKQKKTIRRLYREAMADTGGEVVE